LYTGITSELIKRVYEHKNGLVAGFTKKYKVDNLVYFEVYQEVKDDIYPAFPLTHNDVSLN